MSYSPDQVVVVTARAYDRNAASWSKASADRAGWAASYDMFARHLQPRSRVLDLGCGSGHDALGLTSRGLRLIGLDVSRELLLLARAHLALANALVLGDLRRIPLRDQSFEGIWMDGSLHHIRKADVPSVLRDCRRVLKPGGTLFLSVERGTGEDFVPPPSSEFDMPRWYARFEPDEITRPVEGAALGVIDLVSSEKSSTSRGGFVSLVAKRE